MKDIGKRWCERGEDGQFSIFFSSKPNKIMNHFYHDGLLQSITWPEFANLHPFAPRNQWEGYAEIFSQVEKWLCEITGYDKISLQPNSGASGEYTGLLAIRKYLQSIDQGQRDVCLIPISAHGTNPASANMANMRVVVVDADRHGNINYKDLSAKVEKYKNELAAIMITYPSTHGVFESSVVDVCAKIHENGGQVYLDGANLNAQGACRYPLQVKWAWARTEAGISLHGICVLKFVFSKMHLAPFLPGHSVVPVEERKSGAVSAAPYGSSSIIPITWAYIRMMAGVGLKEASQMAILNANYMAKRLEAAYRIVYKATTSSYFRFSFIRLLQDEQGLVAHEFIIDCKDFKKTAGVEVVDIAKRLMDYGFHAPTMSFPVHDCFMIEPTESEDKDEMDRLVDSLLAIREEIALIETGRMDRNVNPLKMAPHTLAVLTATKWDRPYSREVAGFPKPWCAHKVWPSVSRIDEQYGDRNLICSCPPTEAYAEQ
ncbi:unnamed protein product [Gongylonema pulchrum]|uniref:glycine dehydrogenase (aminomethyl-transferring) n=1 Tax=Gongylonema pulchrum TaxID=637853 RepID=A0A183DQ04_9BILA|nr:unnamed protein product [Gongylonema pulchrum]